MRWLVVTICLLTILTPPSHAADTLATWDTGAGNFEPYPAVDGVGETVADQAVAGAMVMGWGVAHRFSAYLATFMSADGYLTGAETQLNLGAFGTPIDTDHFDVDLLLDMRVGGDGMNEAVVMPAVELNLDRAPDLAAYGLYFRGSAEIAGRETELGQPERHVDLGLTLGTYFTLSQRHQLLLQYDATVHDNPGPETRKFEHGAVALGYNALLGDNLELITETKVGIAQGDGAAALGFMVGFIATLPGIAD